MLKVEIVVSRDEVRVGVDRAAVDETRYIKTLTGEKAAEALAKAITQLQGEGQDAYNGAFDQAFKAAGIERFPQTGGEDKKDL